MSLKFSLKYLILGIIKIRLSHLIVEWAHYKNQIVEWAFEVSYFRGFKVDGADERT
ncbi:MAG: hypothetical protein AB7D38_09940 [Sulfurimonas sp.]|uniref:hypothetical protein n=1 Tax=Sulfurimonas sp. TaxID=2022749 RepID=UPI003D13D51E